MRDANKIVIDLKVVIKTESIVNISVNALKYETKK